MGLIYALAALGISLIWSASGLFNFAQGDLLTVGGYVMLSTFAHWALPYPLAFALTVGVMGLAGYLLSRGYFFPMFSQGLHPDIIVIGTVSLTVLLHNCDPARVGAAPPAFQHAPSETLRSTSGGSSSCPTTCTTS